MTDSHVVCQEPWKPLALLSSDSHQIDAIRTNSQRPTYRTPEQSKPERRSSYSRYPRETDEENMGLRALPLPSSHTTVSYLPHFAGGVRVSNYKFRVSAQSDKGKEEEGKKKKEQSKQSLFGMVTEALDFAQVRSEEDAELLEDAREATRSGERMSREQYGALRRKIGGTYKDFFKSYVEVDGQYVEEGWVDKTCKICKKDTKGEPRQVDKLGRYAHVACLDNSKSSGNFFTRLFSR